MADRLPQTRSGRGIHLVGLRVRAWLFVVLLAVLALPGGAQADEPDEDEFVFGGDYTLPAGQTLDGNLVVFGGTATLESGARVIGDVVVFGGSVVIDGEVDGSVSVMGGSLSLGSQAVVHGDVSSLGGSLERAEGAQILGELNAHEREESARNHIMQDSVAGRMIGRALDFLWSAFLWFAFSALAVLVVIFAPNATSRAAQTLVAQPGMSALVGLLVFIVALPVLLLLAITILLSPLAFLGLLALVAAVMFGWIALGLEAGRRLADAFRREWAPPVSAGVGTFLLTFVAFSLNDVLNWLCVGWVFPLIVGMAGLGAAALSQFGRRVYLVTPPETIAPVPPEM